VGTSVRLTTALAHSDPHRPVARHRSRRNPAAFQLDVSARRHAALITPADGTCLAGGRDEAGELRLAIEEPYAPPPYVRTLNEPTPNCCHSPTMPLPSGTRLGACELAVSRTSLEMVSSAKWWFVSRP
jgi:hypothetical protein